MIFAESCLEHLASPVQCRLVYIVTQYSLVGG